MLEKVTLRNFLSTLLVIVLILAIIGSLVFAFNLGKNSVISEITNFRDISLELSSKEVMNELREMFPQQLNHTQLLTWQSSRLKYVDSLSQRHTNPLEIIESGVGRCGEFAFLYTSICLANDIPARLVTDLNVDHAWTEINPTKDGITWIHVDPTECCTRIANDISVYQEPATLDHPLLYSKYWESSIKMTCAFQVIEENEVIIVDRTAIYLGK